MGFKEDANAISKVINNMSFDYKSVAQELSHDHRTLQQNMMRLCAHYIVAMSTNSYDDRNEASVKFAKEILEKVDAKFMYFPHI